MNRLFYPAIFHKEDGGFWISFPDFPECFSDGDDMQQAYENAVDALGLAITSRQEENEFLIQQISANLKLMMVFLLSLNLIYSLI